MPKVRIPKKPSWMDEEEQNAERQVASGMLPNPHAPRLVKGKVVAINSPEYLAFINGGED